MNLASTPMRDGIHERVVTVTVDGEIARVALNRPAKRNALSTRVVDQLSEAFDTLLQSVRVVVLTGEGEHFSAGLDLSELPVMSPAESMMYSRAWYSAFDKIQFGRVPVIAVMHGAVIGGRLELASSTHVRIAEESAYFGQPEGQRGIFLGGGGSVRIPKTIGASRVVLVGRFTPRGGSRSPYRAF